MVYLTTQAHHCIEKALRIAGLAEAQVRHVPIDERFRMRPEALADAIAADRAQGLRPWLIIAAAGTTDTGAVDPLDAIAEIAQRERCWFHVDAAYGGFFLLTEHGRRLLKGIERSDSVVLDPHKGLFLPCGSASCWSATRALLAATHSYSGALHAGCAARSQSEISPADVSPELSKHFRALRMWLPLILLGTAPFGAALEEKLLLARYFHREIQTLGFEVGPVARSLDRDLPLGSPRRDAGAGQRAQSGDRRWRPRDGRVFLSSTMLDGRFTIRLVAVLNFRTHRSTIDLALRILTEQVDRLRS